MCVVSIEAICCYYMGKYVYRLTKKGKKDNVKTIDNYINIYYVIYV